MAELELQNSSLRRAMAAKDAQLAVVQAESEAWRRVQGPALNGISAKADSQQDLAQVMQDVIAHHVVHVSMGVSRCWSTC